MTNEEMERTMEFITEQQAQFAANIQRLQEERIHDNQIRGIISAVQQPISACS